MKGRRSSVIFSYACLAIVLSWVLVRSLGLVARHVDDGRANDARRATITHVADLEAELDRLGLIADQTLIPAAEALLGWQTTDSWDSGPPQALELVREVQRFPEMIHPKYDDMLRRAEEGIRKGMNRPSIVRVTVVKGIFFAIMREYEQIIRQVIADWRHLQQTGRAFQETVVKFIRADAPTAEVESTFHNFDQALREHERADSDPPRLSRLGRETHELCRRLGRSRRGTGNEKSTLLLELFRN